MTLEKAVGKNYNNPRRIFQVKYWEGDRELML